MNNSGQSKSEKKFSFFIYIHDIFKKLLTAAGELKEKRKILRKSCKGEMEFKTPTKL